MASRLQAANAGPKPILFRVNYDAGHGITDTIAQQVSDWTDIYTPSSCGTSAIRDFNPPCWLRQHPRQNRRHDSQRGGSLCRLGIKDESMIAHLRGRLLSKAPNQAIIDCGGVGYEATISVATFSALPGEGAEASLHIFTHVREDQIALFGFAETQEKRLFEKLLTITGIGPKLAITVLSGIAADRLVTAIRGQDHATLTRIPGIGKKTAERVVLELKDKLDDLATAPASGGVHHGAAGDDALSALVNLGYARPAAERAIEAAIKKDAGVANDFEALFRAAMAAIR